FRSNSIKEYQNGRVHGYQSELDTSKRAWSAGIYDEGRRGWLYPLTINTKGGAAFNNGGWNKVRIEAIGNSIKTFMNGVQCANLVDDMTAQGFIALQVHSIRDKAQEGKTIQWKNIKIVTENLEQYRTKNQPHARQISYLTNSLTQEEKRKGWRLLWDGKTTDGWKGSKSDHFPKHGIEMVDGTIHFLKHEKTKDNKRSGDIVTKEKFDNFELEADFMFKKGGNSGIKYFVDALTEGDGRSIGFEFQVLDKNHADFDKGVDGNRTIGSLYDLIAAENLSEASRTDIRANGPDRWNRARIIVSEGKVQHWINHIKVVEYDRFSQSMKNLIKKSKYAKHKGFGVGSSGRILLQDHSPGDVKFKNIKIREF
ncbi:MAG: 3-keto-disaccharide hydrolase, partial [Flavobacteriaceae bacterium]